MRWSSGAYTGGWPSWKSRSCFSVTTLSPNATCLPHWHLVNEMAPTTSAGLLIRSSRNKRLVRIVAFRRIRLRHIYWSPYTSFIELCSVASLLLFVRALQKPALLPGLGFIHNRFFGGPETFRNEPFLKTYLLKVTCKENKNESPPYDSIALTLMDCFYYWLSSVGVISPNFVVPLFHGTQGKNRPLTLPSTIRVG